MRFSLALCAVAGLVAAFAACQLVEARHPERMRRDETYYIQGAYVMMTTGDWLTPRYDSGVPRFVKPVLTYWLVGGSFRLFGLGPIQARLPVITLSLASLLFVYGLGWVLFRDRLAALLAVVVHVTTQDVYANAHCGRTDAILSFFVVCAVYFFARLIFEPGRERRDEVPHGGHDRRDEVPHRGLDRRDAILAYAATACAILTKGLVGVAFILLPVAVFLAVCRHGTGKSRWRAVASPWGLAVMFLLVVPWFAFAFTRHGEAFAGTFVHDQLAEKVGGSKWYILTNIGHYPLTLLWACMPWTVPVLLAFVTNDSGVRRTFREFRERWIFLAVWIGVPMLILMFGNATRGRYLLPALPAATVAAGFWLSRLGTSEPRPRASVWGLYVLAAVGLLVGIGYTGIFFKWRYAIPEPAWLDLVLAFFLIIAALAIFLLVRRRVFAMAAVCLGFASVAFMLLSSAFTIVPGVNSCAASVAEEALARLPKDAPLASVGLEEHARAIVLLWSGRPVNEWTVTQDDARLRAFLEEYSRKPGYRLLLMDEKTCKRINREDLQGWELTSLWGTLLSLPRSDLSILWTMRRASRPLPHISPEPERDSGVYLLARGAPGSDAPAE